MRTVKAPVGIGYDASTYVTPSQAAHLADAGYEIRFGYLRRDRYVNERPDLSEGPLTWPVSMSRVELREHLDVGFVFSPVQFARFNGLAYLSDVSGHEIGGAAAWNAKSLELPKGATVWCDAEWTDCPDTWWAKRRYLARVIAYLRAWGEAVYSAGYRPGAYIGFQGLSAAQWYALPYFQAYWLSAMRYVKAPEKRGCCCYQGWEHSRSKAKYGRPPVYGVSLDTDFARYDMKGDRFYCVAA